MAQIIFKYDEYMELIRNCISLHCIYNRSSTLDLVTQITKSTHNDICKAFMVDESLLQRIAIANLCDMALMQLDDSKGEVDYAGLGRYSYTALNSIINNLNNF